ncbi:MAG: long-chain fatty acid--CoA ligase [Bacteroidetes bacterium GWE2_39_28]|nr:MAG: long-chain fatty acid--CoA ligase [Bacteroidetes bacterium GWE2_39_28]OFY11658.1 MAG: long-chain fatty acid--CoA ligase [Bacteroidetes bacterium GWF2_39_10]OFZ07515.1 MAG: long-chain fatty acid--CoA ligase [Bacteroidetes bacterium RIFOXYB2_FULL_39_7]OFZ11560.1 MAG: long-chain fatty acid--CoA ligase [Bacteroidetes bacterium RIFOXYC2_FULL_39_11]HCT94745.1 long-chain fatty acid--CoA ligase [Rikenellaceae bacterium]
MRESFNLLLQNSLKENWDYPALSDYKGITLNYKDVARRIEKLHIVYETCGVKKGDKIALCSKNQANWGVVFLSALTYGAVAVPILHEFKPGNIHHIVNHSESLILFAGDAMWEQLNETEMPNLQAVIMMNDFSVLFAKDQKIVDTREHLNEMFGKKYPKNFRQQHIKYHEDSPEELSMINYTSGTTGFSKGVMIPYRALRSNVDFAKLVQPHLNNTSNVVAMLPTAHMYGMMFEFLFEMTVGAHVHFLTRIPSPKIIMDAFAEIKPDIVVSVPLIIEKIYKKKLQPILNKTSIRVLLRLPVIDQKIQKKIKAELVKTFGGRFYEVIIGGAAFNKEAEAFFTKIGFPFTVGYGMTECAPIITYAPWNNTRLYSCGKAAPGMKIKIDSSDPEKIPGEILCKGDNVMLGYYKNPDATDAVMQKDGWLRTGDMGVIDSDGYLYIRGRSKSMILGPSGQNIYPEEIESIINNLPYVVESLVIEDKGALTALIYPDFEQAEADGLTESQLEKKIEELRYSANEELPNYCKIQSIKIFPEEFEKTPKRSIKRFLYQPTEI